MVVCRSGVGTEGSDRIYPEEAQGFRMTQMEKVSSRDNSEVCSTGYTKSLTTSDEREE